MPHSAMKSNGGFIGAVRHVPLLVRRNRDAGNDVRMLAPAIALVISLASVVGAVAQSYPVRPVRWVIGFPAGGSADTVTRIMCQWLSERLGQPFIVENKPGAATNIASQAVISSPPDGYTLLYAGSSAAVNASFFETLPFNFLRDIAPVSGLGTFPFVLVANPAVPAKNVAELVALAKANPGKITMASFGAGTSSHLAGELFKAMAGVNLVHVPYRGEGYALNDMVGGQVQVMFDTLTASLPIIRSGRLRAIAVAGAKRYDGLPDVPTVAETVPGYDASSWGGVGAPRGTPKEIVDKLNREINAGLADPAVKARLADLAVTPLVMSPEEFGAYLASETERWAMVVKFSGAKPE
jgi:tripartite-type tricarboxylate transporter receptor subunit TctC